MSAGELRKWIAIGTGVGIEVGHQDLNVTVARVRPTGVRILGELTIPKFRSQPAAEWGAACTSFLKKVGARTLTATVMLPKEDVTVRQVSLPGVTDRDAYSALSYQIDSLHPYSDSDTAWDWARIGKTGTFLVGITRREMLEKYVTLFAEAGVKISAFTFSGAVMYSAARFYTLPPADGFLGIGPVENDDGEQSFEVYGESPSRPLFAAHLEMPEQRARSLALSELRLPPDAEPLPFEAILPKPQAAPAGEDVSRAALPYATALAGACPWLCLRLNMLPEKERAARSRLVYIPTIVLTSALLILMVALALGGTFENKRYLATVEQQIAVVEPPAKKATNLERDTLILRNRAQTLDNFRLRSKDDMDALNDLTRVLPAPTWLNGMQLTRTQLSIAGQTDQSTPLLKALDGTRQFKRSEFSLPMTRVANGEAFSIRSAREGAVP